MPKMPPKWPEPAQKRRRGGAVERKLRLRREPNSAQSCTSAHSSLASRHLGASRAAQLAAALRPLAVPLRAERRA